MLAWHSFITERTQCWRHMPQSVVPTGPCSESERSPFDPTHKIAHQYVDCRFQHNAGTNTGIVAITARGTTTNRPLNYRAFQQPNDDSSTRPNDQTTSAHHGSGPCSSPVSHPLDDALEPKSTAVATAVSGRACTAICAYRISGSLYDDVCASWPSHGEICTQMNGNSKPNRRRQSCTIACVCGGGMHHHPE